MTVPEGINQENSQSHANNMIHPYLDALRRSYSHSLKHSDVLRTSDAKRRGNGGGDEMQASRGGVFVWYYAEIVDLVLANNKRADCFG